MTAAAGKLMLNFFDAVVEASAPIMKEHQAERTAQAVAAANTWVGIQVLAQ